MNVRDYLPWLPKEVITAMNKQFDSKQEVPLPNLRWISAAQVNVVAGAGQSPTLDVMFSDNVRRLGTSPMPFSPAVTGSGGLDTGTEASSTWYYIYAVPSTNDLLFEIRGSVNPPSTGPTGVKTSRYLGAVYNNSSSNLLPFEQVEEKFDYTSSRLVVDLGAGSIGTESSPVLVDLTDFVPQTAGACYLVTMLKSQAGSAGFVELYVDGHQSSTSLHQLQAVETDWNQEISDFPVPNIPKVMYRRLEETVGNLDEFKLTVTGWTDAYLAEK